MKFPFLPFMFLANALYWSEYENNYKENHLNIIRINAIRMFTNSINNTKHNCHSKTTCHLSTYKSTSNSSANNITSEYRKGENPI